jgi:hypothetical protein
VPVCLATPACACARRCCRRPRCYPSDTTDAEWALIAPLLPVPACQTPAGGRPEANCRRAVAPSRTGCATPSPAPTEIVEIDGGRLFFPDERATEFTATLRRHWDSHP